MPKFNPESINTGIITGQITQSFTLTVDKPSITNVGYLSAINPVFWGPPLLDLNQKSKLHINVAGGTINKCIFLTFELGSTYDNPTTKDGKVSVDFTYYSTKKDMGYFRVPFQPVPFKQYYVQSDVMNVDFTTIELTCPDFPDLIFKSVKVDIFIPAVFRRDLIKK